MRSAAIQRAFHRGSAETRRRNGGTTGMLRSRDTRSGFPTAFHILSLHNLHYTNSEKAAQLCCTKTRLVVLRRSEGSPSDHSELFHHEVREEREEVITAETLRREGRAKTYRGGSDALRLLPGTDSEPVVRQTHHSQWRPGTGRYGSFFVIFAHFAVKTFERPDGDPSLRSG